MLKEAKDTQRINSGGSSNDNMASDFSTPQSHAKKDGSSVISKVCCVRVALSHGFINRWVLLVLECFGFLNIHILCGDGDWLSLLGAFHLHVSFSITPRTDER